jgi:Histidine kinase-, DNA gyrase B-, and HSP90-like ATPase
VLCEFITLHRDNIVARTRNRVRGRPWPSVSSGEIEHGVPLFLTQLSETLQREATAAPFSSDTIGSTATRHGAEMLAAGFSMSQVVHDYGDICQTITEIALEQHAPITVEEFHTLNRCFDTAIAEAVAEHTRPIAQKRSDEELERLGQAAHELRNLLNGAMLHSEYRGIRLTVAPVDPTLAVMADPQLLASAVMNLLHNAFKNTRSGGAVVRRARAEGDRLLLEIEDECGGIPEGKTDLFQAFGNRRGTDRSGLGLGLSIARKAVRAHGGDITIRNMPGRAVSSRCAAGCRRYERPAISLGVQFGTATSLELENTSRPWCCYKAFQNWGTCDLLEPTAAHDPRHLRRWRWGRVRAVPDDRRIPRGLGVDEFCRRHRRPHVGHDARHHRP